MLDMMEYEEELLAQDNEDYDDDEVLDDATEL